MVKPVHMGILATDACVEHGEDGLPLTLTDLACVELANSEFTDHGGGGEHVDRLRSAEWLEAFLERHDLTPDSRVPAPLDRLAALRRELREVLENWAQQLPLSRQAVEILDERVRGVPLRRRLDDTGSAVTIRDEPVERSWQWVIARITMSAVQVLRHGDPRRLKTCGDRDCRRMFYDTTMSNSNRLCSAERSG